MQLIYLFSVWLHILSAAVWIGGMVFFGVVLVPVIRRPESQGVAASLVQLTGLRFRLAGWLCLAILFLTGFFNLFYRGFAWADLRSGRLWEGAFGRALSLKLLLFGVVLMLSIVHDFSIGPRATELWRTDSTSPQAGKLRRQASWIGRLNLLLALLIVALGIMLVRGWPW